ncbi:hypothetical protein CP8484711_0048A, partial [Chlamydia psittaci 84-8471/1]
MARQVKEHWDLKLIRRRFLTS